MVFTTENEVNLWALVTYGLVKQNSAHMRLPAASVPTSPLPVLMTVDAEHT